MRESLRFFATAEKEGQVAGSVDVTSGSPPITLDVDRDLLPDRGSFLGAWYLVTLEITPRSESEERFERVDADESDAVLDGEIHGDRFGVRLRAADESVVGHATLEYLDAAWVDESSVSLPASGDCDVGLTVRYDPGLTAVRTTDGERIENDGESTGTTTELRDLDLTIDYEGRVTGGDADLELPRAIRYALPLESRVVLVLGPDREGFAHPDVDASSERNVVCVDAAGAVEWTVAPVTGHRSSEYRHRYAWRRGDAVLTESRADDGVRYNVVGAETGEIRESVPRSP